MSVGLTLQPRKKPLVAKTDRVETGLMEGRRPGETRSTLLYKTLIRAVLRPRLRWEDGVEVDAARLGCRNWTIVALNREGWRKLLKENEASPGL